MFDWLISTAHAQQGAPAGDPGGGMMFTMMMFGSIILIWWLIVIRPQANQARTHRKMVSELKRGDSVVMSSGMFGKVAAVEESALLIEVAKGTKVRYLKDKVARTYSPGDDPAQNTDSK